MPTVVKGLERPVRFPPKHASTLSEEEKQLFAADGELLEALLQHNTDRAKSLITAGQEINVATEGGLSTMHQALKGILEKCLPLNTTPSQEHLDFLDYLVKHGAYVDHGDNNNGNFRPIHVCINGGDAGTPLLRFLLDLRYEDGSRAVDLRSVKEHDGHTLLHDAAWQGNTDNMRLLLETGEFADMIRTTNKQGQEPLHIAAFRAPQATCQLLCENGADHRATERNPRRLSKDTPDVIAASMGREDTANYLRNLNVTVNAVQFAAKMKKGVAAS